MRHLRQAIHPTPRRRSTLPASTAASRAWLEAPVGAVARSVARSSAHERVRKSTHGRHTAPRSRIHTPSAIRCTAAIRAPRSHIHAFTHSPHDDAPPPPRADITHSHTLTRRPQLDAQPPPHTHIHTHSHAARMTTHGRHHTHSHTLTQSATRRTAAIPPTPRIDAFEARSHDRPRCVSRASCVTRRECGRAAHLRRRLIHSSDRPSKTACRVYTSASQNALSRRGYA